MRLTERSTRAVYRLYSVLLGLLGLAYLPIFLVRKVWRAGYPVAAGQRLTVIVTSAEPLRSPPTVTLAQAGLAARSAAAVKRSDGRFQAVFTVAPGGSGPATVTVAGIDTGGHRNLSQTTVTVQ